MRCRLLAILGGGLAVAFPALAFTPAPASVIVVVGAPGGAGYASNFVSQAALWQKAAASAGRTALVVGLETPSDPPDRDRFQQAVAAQSRTGPDPLWLVLIGHGTFDGQEARFNLRGPDASAGDLAGWLQTFERPVVIINTASASAPFLNRLSATNRIVLTATRSGHEENATRLGLFLAQTITDPKSDLDQDGQTSLLEAFLAASHRVAEFYQTEGRLATEHALIDDNGDGLGTPADWFRGVRAIKKPADRAALDGTRAHQLHLVPSAEETRLSPALRAERDALELQVAQLRERKTRVAEEEYYQELEALLIRLARLSVGQQ